MAADGGRAGRLRRALVTAVTVITTAGIAATGAGCRAEPAAPASTSRPIPAAVPAAEAAAIRATVDSFNATAAGTPSDQQQRLADLVDPDRRDQVTRCPAAVGTLRLEPVYRGLRALGGDPGATTYALPTLIRVYTGGRLTGTDLTTLQLMVKPAAGSGRTEAFLTPFCVN